MIYYLKTFSCNNCPYHQDFPQTRANIDIHFPNEGLVQYQCPSCKVGSIAMNRVETTKSIRAIQVTEAEIDKEKKEIVDEQGTRLVSLTNDEKQEKLLQARAELAAFENNIREVDTK